MSQEIGQLNPPGEPLLVTDGQVLHLAAARDGEFDDGVVAERGPEAELVDLVVKVPDLDLPLDVAEEEHVGLGLRERARGVHDVGVGRDEDGARRDVVGDVVAVVLLLLAEHPEHEVVVVDRQLEVRVEGRAFEGVGVAQVAHEAVLVDQLLVRVVLEVHVAQAVVDDFLGARQRLVDEAQLALVGRDVDEQLVFLVHRAEFGVEHDLVAAQGFSSGLVLPAERDDADWFPFVYSLQLQVGLFLVQNLLQVPDN